ncbi:cupin domain-containing protein [Deinococcus peraridilitoris]|uniref:Cupin domain-containing protein n=1 Tax=Deinococcus peraridilitoris (strain DSM 19664 / LMG 22246 / CIP 109416 / KR-200) TaxID=937777 RepID=L0A2Y9_DEIPD|nr:cupin domain-containing protein [Deinococcus peraridilitoris]AFZ68201.1 cupin domain-containing protein [Deinococcus peraridilitoris DSM 19664]
MSTPGTTDTLHQVRLSQALQRLPGQGGERFATVFERGSLSVEVYAPRGVDRQTPHTRDEVYIVACGQGHFECNGERVSFQAGDFLFAPAFAPHRFVDFTDDLVVWVLFYGPPGGENAPVTTPFTAMDLP